jgi:hypothetical protein
MVHKGSITNLLNYTMFNYQAITKFDDLSIQYNISISYKAIFILEVYFYLYIKNLYKPQSKEIIDQFHISVCTGRNHSKYS